MGFPAVEYYRLRTQQLGIEQLVTFTGRIPYGEGPQYLALGDLAVAPKISATEGSGKLLNYMAMSLPTVVFDTSVSREYLGRWGVYAERGNPVALAEAINALLKDQGRASALGHQLRLRAMERYSLERVGKELVRIHEACGRP